MTKAHRTVFSTERRVEFSDTDLAGFVHFTNYLRYMEEAEYEFLRSIDLDVIMTDQRGRFGFPRIAVECQYRRPVHYGETIRIEIVRVEHTGKSIGYEMLVHHNDDVVAWGRIEAACCRFRDVGDPFAILIPDSVVSKLAPHVNTRKGRSPNDLRVQPSLRTRAVG